jgi:hypothetical protein
MDRRVVRYGRAVARLLVSGLASLLVMARAAWAHSGALDPSFGRGGAPGVLLDYGDAVRAPVGRAHWAV